MVPKKFGIKKIWGPKEFGVRKNLWCIKTLGSEKKCGSNKISSPKFGTEKNYDRKKFLGPKKYGSNKI